MPSAKGLPLTQLRDLYGTFLGLFAPDVRARLPLAEAIDALDFHEVRWLTQPLPWSNKRGVYAFMNSQQVVYVGKATMDSTLGSRVWCHIWPTSSDVRIESTRLVFPRCEPRLAVHEPSHVAAVVFDDELVPLAAALEEWLLRDLQPSPPGNIQGVGRVRNSPSEHRP